jgi:sulfide:quinone oxidoreductase
VNATTPPNQPFDVLIAGGGVAALEGALALRDLAPARVRTTLLAPDSTFVYRPARVKEPFGYATARTYPLAELAQDIGVELVPDRFSSLDAGRSVVHTEQGRELGFDALLLAIGAQLRPAFSHGLAVDDSRIDEQLHGLIQDVEGGYVNSIAFVAPPRMAWPLPVYEVALMTARRAYEMQTEVAITITTPEDAPLAVFGDKVSVEVGRLLKQNGITVITSAQASVPEAGTVVIEPGDRTLKVDRIVALQQLYGPSAPGVPAGAEGGFIPIDAYCRVQGLENVFAAGDATNFPVKFGGLAAQEADTAAAMIASMAGAPVEPHKFDPVLQAILLGADKPLYLSARVTGAHGSDSEISEEPRWSPPVKIAAKYLAPYLESRDRQAV